MSKAGMAMKGLVMDMLDRQALISFDADNAELSRQIEHPIVVQDG